MSVEHRQYTRRQFLRDSSRAGLALGFGGSLLSACNGGGSPLALLPPDRAVFLPLFSFSAAQRAALSAAVARLIPAQGAGDWSAADAGAVEYIEQLLNAFSLGGNPKIYGGGPIRAQFSDFHRLTRAKATGWKAEVERLRQLYIDGINELDRLARGPLSLLPGDFAGLPELAQDTILEALDLQASPFFGELFDHTMEGVYGHPVYGGNRDYVGWRSVCYQGDVHGVRFPNGYAPHADDRPWDKFGGYSPEEMIQPGSCGD